MCLVVILFCSLLAAWFLKPAPPKRPIINAPFPSISQKSQKKKWARDTANFLSDVTNEFPGKVFQVWTGDGPEVIIPQDLIDEVKRLPDSILSASKGASEQLQARLTTIPIEEDQPGHLGVDFVKSLLTKNLARYVAGMQDEIDAAVAKHFDLYEDWTPIKVHGKMVDIVARTTARIFVGPELCKEERWLKTTKRYALSVVISAQLLKFWPSSLRSIGRFFIPPMYMIWYSNNVAASVVKDVLQRRPDDKLQDIDNLIYQIHDSLPEDLKSDYYFQGLGQLGLAIGAIHTTARVLTEALYNLATYPEITEILRAEAQKVGLFSGTPTIDKVSQLKIMDSFLKETVRLEGGGIITFRRKVLKHVTLSDGTELLPGVYLSVPSSAISSNPVSFENPGIFNSQRFSNQRNDLSAEDGQKIQLVSLDNKNMYFGAGLHACPGRFFAAIEMKLMLATLVTKYDFRLNDGESRPQEFIFQSLRINRDRSTILIRNYQRKF